MWYLCKLKNYAGSVGVSTFAVKKFYKFRHNLYPSHICEYVRLQLRVSKCIKKSTQIEHLPQTQIPKETNPILFLYLLTNSSKEFAWKLENLTKSLLINIDDESFGLASPKRISSLVLVKILKSGFYFENFCYR